MVMADGPSQECGPSSPTWKRPHLSHPTEDFKNDNHTKQPISKHNIQDVAITTQAPQSSLMSNTNIPSQPTTSSNGPSVDDTTCTPAVAAGRQGGAADTQEPWLGPDPAAPLDGHRTSTTPKRGNSPASSFMIISEGDIELQDLRLPVVGTASTEQLILPPSPSSSGSSLQGSSNSSHEAVPEEESTRPPPRIANLQIPNYKPYPLRWPFLTLLLAALAGLFVFFEYEIRNLPPLSLLDYSVIQSQYPNPVNHGTSDSNFPPERRKLPMTTHHAPLARKQNERILSRAIQVADPGADARPQSESYRQPFTPTRTFCGWAAPTWQVRVVADLPSHTAPYFVGQPYSSWAINVTIMVEETIPKFTTDSEASCPCSLGDILSRVKLVPFSDSVDWGLGKGAGGLPPLAAGPLAPGLDKFSWETHDIGCKSVMFAIQSLRGPRSFHLKSSLSTSQLGTAFTFSETFTINPSMFGLPGTSITTPPVQLTYRPDWQYPLWDTKGTLMIPLASRAAGVDRVDVFGNLVKSADIATFPEGWKGDFEIIYDDALSSFYRINPCLEPFPGVPCSRTVEEPKVIKTVWWSLQFRGPLPSFLMAPPSPVITETTSNKGPDFQTSNPPPSIAFQSLPTVTKTESTRNNEPGPGIASPPPLPTITCCDTDTARRTAISHSPGGREEQPLESQTSFLTIFVGSSIGAQPGQLSPAPAGPSIDATSKLSRPIDEIPPSVPESTPSLDSNIKSTLADENFTVAITTNAVWTDSSNGPSLGSTGGFSTGSLTAKDEIMAPAITVTDSLASDSGGTMPSNDKNSRRTSRTASITERPNPVGTISALIDHPQTRVSAATSVQFESVGYTTLSQEPSQKPRPHPHPQDCLFQSLVRKHAVVHPVPDPFPYSPDHYSVDPSYFNLFRSEIAYLMVSVIPVLLTTILLVLLQVMITSLNSIMPFRALGHPDGALLRESLSLSRNPNVFSAPFIAARHIRCFRDPLPLLATLATVFGTLLVTLSSDVMWIEFGVNCVEGSLRGCQSVHLCRYALRMSTPLMRAAEVLTVVLAILILAILALLRNWRSGVPADPWSIASITSMISSDKELLQLLRASSTSPEGKRQSPRTFVERVLDGRRFRLGFSFRTSQSPTGDGAVTTATYGIQVVPVNTDDSIPIQPTVKKPPLRKSLVAKKSSPLRPVSPATWELAVRILALLFLIGLLNLVLHYETTVGVNTGFEKFMNSRTVGVRILFAAFGTIIDAFWNYYFSYASESQVYRLLAKKPHRRAESSILLSPPSNIFAGLWRSAAHVRDDSLTFHIAAAAFLAKFTPIVLSQIPFSYSVTFKIHEVCTWLSVGVLSYMVVVLLVSVLLTCRQAKTLQRASNRFRFLCCCAGRRKCSCRGEGLERSSGVSRGCQDTGIELPVRTDTIAGCLYYVYDSPIVRDFEGLSMAKSKTERDRLVVRMGKWYCIKGNICPENDGGPGGVEGGVSIGKVRVDYVCT